MSPELIQALLVALVSVLASTGFWTYILGRDKKRNATHRLLMNLAYGKIVKVGMAHIALGEISRDDLEELQKDLYDPYLELGGNGIAKRVMEEVAQLPLRQPPRYARIERADRTEDHGH